MSIMSDISSRNPDVFLPVGAMTVGRWCCVYFRFGLRISLDYGVVLYDTDTYLIMFIF
jgi:hypothetical protein